MLRVPFAAAAALLGLAGPAQAKDLVLELPAHFIVETFAAPGPNDPDRCAGASFFEFPAIKNARGYEIVATDVRYKQGTQSRTGPPFPADDHRYGAARWKAPAGFHRVYYSGGSTGKGCAEMILALDGQWRLDSARVNMSRKFQRRVDEDHKLPPKRCALTKRTERYTLKGSAKTIIRRTPGGRITITPDGKGPQRVASGVVVTPGTVVETGKGAWMQITTPSGGGSLIVGPETKVRVTSKGIDVLERSRFYHPPPAKWIDSYAYPNGSRTCRGWAPQG